jgi:glycosyltransferase involved in cell wall biosynthesis
VTAAVPKVSVCIPTYKGGRTIGPAIASVLAQTFADFELLVIDDCSPDDTAEVVGGFRDPRLRYLRNGTNLGPEGNWNRCLSEARGRYFKLLPHDDLLAPQCLAVQVAALDADRGERIALTFSARHVLGPDGTVLMQRGYPGAQGGVLRASSVLASCLRRGTNLIGEPGAVMFRRKLVERVGTFSAAHPYVIDLDYWCRLLDHGDAHYTPAPLASFRVSRSQWSVRLGQAQCRDFMGLVQDLAARGHACAHIGNRTMAALTARLNQFGRQWFYRHHLPPDPA